MLTFFSFSNPPIYSRVIFVIANNSEKWDVKSKFIFETL